MAAASPQPGSNRYLDGIRRRSSVRAVWRVGALWIALVCVCWVLWDVFEGEPPALLRDFLLLGVSVAIILATRRARLSAESPLPEMQSAETALLRDDHPRAVALLRELLASRLSPLRRANSLLLLGRSAEAVGDFEDAAGVFAEALRALPARRGFFGMAFAQVAPVIAARHAFALAAVGRLDEAEARLAEARHRDAFPGARALAIRAQALVLARRGQAQALIDLCSRERILIASSLVYRDKVLLRALEAWAKTRVLGAFRAAPLSMPGIGADAELRTWIERAAPQAAEVLGQPPTGNGPTSGAA